MTGRRLGRRDPGRVPAPGKAPRAVTPRTKRVLPTPDERRNKKVARAARLAGFGSRSAGAAAAPPAAPVARLVPAIDALTPEECTAVVAIFRASDGLGAADRELQHRFPGWDPARRLGALRQAQNAVFADWLTDAGRKSRERLGRQHAGEPLRDQP